MKRVWCASCLLFVLVIGPLSGCGRDAEVPAVASGPIAVGEERVVELRFLRFDVSNYEQTLSREDLLALPEDVQRRLWLLDLDLTNGPNSPRLLENALRAIARIDPQELDPAARNMQALLTVTPDTVNLEGTSLEQLISLAPLIGIAPERVLSDLLGVGVEENVLSSTLVTETILEQVIATHPRAQTRLGPRTPENPEGIYPVTPGTLPITLRDVVSDLETLPETFGETNEAGVYHPGFLAGEVRATLLEDDFSLTVRANANALPYKGIDLTDGSGASVNSLRSQILDLFDFEDPSWLRIEGLVAGEPVIEELTFRIVEDDAFIPGGKSPTPAGRGDSDVWRLPAWTLESVLVGAASRAFATHDQRIAYGGTPEDPLFVASVEDGWQTISVTGDLGAPPPPSYLWDVLLEVGQVRLHDGGIPEGDADVEFTLRDVPSGVDAQTIEETIRSNLQDDPRTLLGVATEIIDTTRGDADFYYWRAPADAPLEDRGDWLFFVASGDIALGEDDLPVRDYDYSNPGFFADDGLSEKLSDKRALGGDNEHEKIRVFAGDVLYVEDDAGAVFELEVGEKPSTGRLSLTITRIR